MIKRFIYLITLLNYCFLFSQVVYNIKVYYQKKEDTITLLLDNNDPFPYSFEFFEQPKVENMRSVVEHFPNKYVIEGNTAKVRLAQFIPLDKKHAFAFKKIPKFSIRIGNIWKEDYDSDYVYDLPYLKREKFLLSQGYYGWETHQNQNALDFKMPEGTEILAAREGYVIELKQDSNTGCPDRSCANQGNYIKIIHADGTIADYYHIRMNGAKVKFGDKVEKGQTIALSGNTGWSTGPHLHFMCYLPRPKGKNISIKTLFRVDDGEKVKFLNPGSTYKRNY
ncbi:M23 family metallopeptidase [Epilithonimonas sp.]|uniref:M23 family metallopeptidase n=1 Tax=Epilithonimonas sp. TaxID=2894511 RepID=UPI00289A370C|nr:M23 family metallopeptidase [Epilithonimonas sp.]